MDAKCVPQLTENAIGHEIGFAVSFKIERTLKLRDDVFYGFQLARAQVG